MSDCLAQLDMILSMAETEYASLRDGDLDTAEHICAQRDRMLAETMGQAGEVLPAELYDRLLLLHSIQQKLRDEATRQREELRGQIFASKQEVRRLSGYRKCVSMALK